MEFNDIDKKLSANKHNGNSISYVNTAFTDGTEGRGYPPGKEEGHYEQLRFNNKPDVSKCNQHEHTLNRIKCMVYIMLAMLIVLYIAVIVVIIIISIPKGQDSVDGNWAQWSPWSSCDVTCGSGSQTRFRTCSNPPHTASGIPCRGSATETDVCRISYCPDNNILRNGSTNDNHASFSARLVGKGILVGPNQRIVFNEVLNNNRNGYDNSSGIFEAPSSGVYLFIYFIEIGISGAYGRVELRQNGKLISYAAAYGMSVDVSISGINNNVTFESTKFEEVLQDILCIGGKFSVSGIRNTVKVQPTLDSCPYENRIVAFGGNSAVAHIRAGEQVWIQTPENKTMFIRPEGTTFTGILLFQD